jgi:hypothetical protein
LPDVRRAAPAATTMGRGKEIEMDGEETVAALVRVLVVITKT